MKLTKHLEKTREERRAHLNLSTPCELNVSALSYRGRLLALLGLNDDVPKCFRHQVHTCHACCNDSGKGSCGNPQHLYFGTAKENLFDRYEGEASRVSELVQNSQRKVEERPLEVWELLLRYGLTKGGFYYRRSALVKANLIETQRERGNWKRVSYTPEEVRLLDRLDCLVKQGVSLGKASQLLLC